MAKHFAKEADIEILEITDVPMFNETDDQTESAVIQTFNTKSLKLMGLSSLHQNTITHSIKPKQSYRMVVI